MPSTDESGQSAQTVAVSETSDPVDDSIGDKLGKYELKRHLATGGMAEIYLAEQVGPEGFAKEIVIKRILPHLAKDGQFTDMFLDEARLAANLNHPNIGQIHELGDDGGDYFIAMEYIDGASVEELLIGAVDIPFDVSARIVVDVLQALDFAHESKGRDGEPLGLVHRDVTPSNVMVSVDGIVKLVDFGVAKAAKKSHQTQTGAVKGKFAYMAPEQVESGDVDRRADIFAIGIVFYELLTGVKPFGDELAAVSRILHSEPEHPQQVNPQVPEPFAEIIMRALSKDPGDRYPTAHTMLLDIETALRMENSYVGPRELSYVVRAFRGMELPAGASLSVHDTGLFAADRSGEGEQIDARRELEHDETAAIALAETQAVTPVPTPPKDGDGAPPRSKLPTGSKKLAIAGVAAIAAAVTVGGAVSWYVSQESVSPLVTGEPREVVLNTTPLVMDGADPDLLRDPEGAPIVIDSIPPTQVYRRGKLVGETPLRTRLSPGKYKIDLAIGDDRKSVSFEVGNSGYERQRFVLADLERDADPKSKRKKRRKGGFQRLKNLLSPN